MANNLISLLTKSILSLGGTSPKQYNLQTKLGKVKPNSSTLDLDAKTPKKYLDNTPN
jgi:hypothetical protein